MANAWLCFTSLLMLIAHIAAVHEFRGPLILKISYVTGPITSMLNHGMTSDCAKMGDRAAMVAGCFLDFYYMKPYGLAWCAMVWAVTAYGLRHHLGTHTIAHALITLAHTLQLASYSRAAAK